MKLIKYILSFLLIFFFYVESSSFAYDDQNIRWDRIAHFNTGMVSSVTLTMWAKNFGIKEDYGLFGIGSSFVLGYLKECSDQNTFKFRRWNDRNYDKNDAYYDLLSTVLGGIFGKFLTYTF